MESAARINEYVQLQSLRKNLSKFKIHPFEELRYNSNCKYEVFTNSKTLLSLYIDSDYPFFLNFNSQNGHLIELQSLFKDGQYSKVIAKRNEKLEKRISDKLAEVTQNVLGDSLKTFFQKKKGDFYHNYSISDHRLVLRSPTGNEELKQKQMDVGLNINWDVELEYSEITDLLSELGKALIQGMGNIRNEIPLTRKVKFLKGVIGENYALTMILNFSFNQRMRSYDIDESFYWYDKVGTGLYLMGSADLNENFWLDVFDLETRTVKEIFEFTFDGNNYIGTWKDMKTGKQLPFRASLY
ncbi:MAG: hypothetical protein KF860_14060 [Cyclobacteriaceae bacterium]|nr:hypothetical protein [Cyclobacteriaceae bacterium]